METLTHIDLMNDEFSRFMLNIKGYECRTCWWGWFTRAEQIGLKAIQDTFKKTLDEGAKNYKDLTELAIVLNYKKWQYFETDSKHFATFSTKYYMLFDEVNNLALEALKGEALEYYHKWAD